MKIKKICITNFRNIKSLELELSDKITKLQGPNGVGKTSIGEAIVFAFTGTIRGIDKNKKDYITSIGKGFCNVIVELDDLIIDRSIKDDKIKLLVNGIEMSQKEFEMKYNFDYDIFISSHWCGEFMKLDTNTRRDILIKRLLKSNREGIVIEHIGKDLYDKYRQYIDLNDLSYSLSNIRKLKRESELSLTTAISEKAAIQNQIKELQDKLFDYIDVYDIKQYENIKQELEKIKNKKPKLEDYINDTNNNNDNLIRVKTLYEQNNKLLQSLVKPSDNKILLLQMKIEEEEKELEKIKSSKICPTCYKSYDSISDIEILLSNFNKRIDIYKQDLEKEKEIYNKQLQEYVDKSNNLKEILNKLNEQKEQLLLQNAGYIDKQKALFIKDVEQWEKEYNAIYDEYIKIEKEYNQFIIKDKYKREISEQILLLKSKIEELDKIISDNNIEELEKIENILLPTGILKIEINSIIDQIRNYLPQNYSITLIRQNKTNEETKEVFDIEDELGVEYKWWSTGQKLVFDIYIANLLSSKSIFNFMIIDNLETLSSEIQIFDDKQIIVMQVSNDNELQIIKQ